MRKRLTSILLSVLLAPAGLAQTVYLEVDPVDAQASYAAERLQRALEDRGYELAARADEGEFRVTLSIDRELVSEAFVTDPGARSLTVNGGDGPGLIYGALAVAEQLRNGTDLASIGAHEEEPAQAFRAIKFNLPWESYRSSSALDLHYDTVRDVKYWEAFLDMMAENRFNALTLWNLHPFPYMIRPRNFPEASPFTDAELAEWRRLYRSIFSMAEERGIETYLVNWNILVSREFAEAHDLEGKNHYPYYKGEADTSEIIKQYTRESVTQVLEEYPKLTGFGFSFGEQMGGMTPRERQDWINDTIVAGMDNADRSSKMIFRAPFSADLGQGGSTDAATEELTREAIENLDELEEPIWMEIKFNWSHGHSTPELVKVHGGELKDTYFTPLPENYRVAWMIRNEDFYALRWGVPDFIREHLELNGSAPYVGGYFVGSENYIPARDYFTATSEPVDWTYAFERQWLFYKLWGRLLYNPSTPDRVFEAEFVRRYGEAASPLLQAYALASSTQLHFASAVDFKWDFTLYGEGMMVLSRNGVSPLSVDRLIIQPPFDPDFVSVTDYVAKHSSGGGFSENAVTPPLLAQRLEANCLEALDLVKGIDTSDNLSLRHEVADVKAWANLGLYFSEKLRGAVALQRFRTTGIDTQKQEAVAHLESALAYWDQVITITRPLYRNMPLTHYNGPNNNRAEDNLFHWELVRPAIARDIEVAKSATVAGN